MEKGDKGSTLTRMGVSGWMFLLVPAYPGCPGQTAVKWLLCCCCCQFFNRIIVFLKCLWISQLHKMCIFPNYLMLMCISAAVSPCVVLCRLSVYGDTHLVMRFTARETYLCLRSMARKIRSISVFVACPPFFVYRMGQNKPHQIHGHNSVKS